MLFRSVSDLIGSLDVEEKARAKDTRARVAEAGSSANMVQKKQQPHKPKFNKSNSGSKGKSDGWFKPSQPTNFKKNNNKPRKGSCHVCSDPHH